MAIDLKPKPILTKARLPFDQGSAPKTRQSALWLEAAEHTGGNEGVIKPDHIRNSTLGCGRQAD